MSLRVQRLRGIIITDRIRKNNKHTSESHYNYYSWRYAYIWVMKKQMGIVRESKNKKKKADIIVCFSW